MSGELSLRFPEPWQLGEKEAEQAFEWIVEGTLPSAIPTTSDGIADLVDRIAPRAMARAQEMFRQSLSGPTAFPRQMFDAIEQGFRRRLEQLLIERARREGLEGGEDVSMFWSKKRTTIEWLAAQYRDMNMVPGDEAMRRAEADYARDPAAATEQADHFASSVSAMLWATNQVPKGEPVDPRRIGRWDEA